MAAGAGFRLLRILFRPILWILDQAPRAVDRVFGLLYHLLRTALKFLRPIHAVGAAASPVLSRVADPLVEFIRPLALPALYVAGAAAVILAVSPAKDESDATPSGPDADMLLPITMQKPVKPSEVFPVAKGDRWTMLVRVDEGSFLMDTVSAGLERFAGEPAYILQTLSGGRPVQEKAYGVSPQGVDRLAVGPHAQTRLDPPMPLLRYPIQPGQELSWSGKLVFPKGETPATAVCKVCCVDHVDTPAGTFDAYRLRILVTAYTPRNEMRYQSRVWLAPGVGIVREEYPFSGRIAVGELLRFTRGRL
ncbi:MAG: hypothetical protein ACP5VE_00670 [Chthonomonadales bacterium]